jgi:hypothetical protein
LKNLFKVIILLVIFVFIHSIKTFAAAPTSIKNNIVLDGNFNDWGDKPFITDNKHDTRNPYIDLVEARYIADDKYLYLDVKRSDANNSEPWYLGVVVLNALKGEKQIQYPYGIGKPIYAPQFDIWTYYIKSNNRLIVNVSFNGEDLESTFSASKDGNEIEFRMPLSKVGLDGVNKQIQFIVKSNSYEGSQEYENNQYYNSYGYGYSYYSRNMIFYYKKDKDEYSSNSDYEDSYIRFQESSDREKECETKGEVDWLPDGKPIIVTTGPTLWWLSSGAGFVMVTFAAYKVYNLHFVQGFRK